MDMDQKETKLTYQKSRLIITLVFVLANYLYNILLTILFGPSDDEFTLKHDKSLLILSLLVAVIVFRQKYELQIHSKYSLEEINLSKIFFLFTYVFFFTLLPAIFTKNGTNLLINFVFILAYSHFYFGAFCRFFGLRRNYQPSDRISLFTEDGGLNFETLQIYW